MKLLLKQGVPKSELVVFKFTDKEINDLVWLKKNEFDLHGNLFDVVRSFKLKDGRTYLECISDNQETILFAKLNQGVSMNLGGDKHSTPLSNWMKVLHFPVVIPEKNSLIVDRPLEADINKPQFHYQFADYTTCVSIDFPPPQISC